MPLKRKPNATDIRIGMRMRLRRIECDLSQQHIADQLGLSFQQVQKYEKGINRIGASRMQQIAAILKVPPAYFFEGLPSDGGPPEKSPTTLLGQTREGQELAAAFLKLP